MEAEPSEYSGKWLAMTGIGSGVLMATLDISIVNISLPTMVESLHTSFATIQWVVICYVLTYSSLMLVFGKLGDLFGYRRIFGIGLFLSMAAFLLCGTAKTFGALLIFRVLQGMGAALVISCSPALATMLFPESMRARIDSGNSIVASAGLQLITSAAPMPCRTRKISSAPKVFAVPHSRNAAIDKNNPMPKMRRYPNRSPSLPKTSMRLE